MRRFPQVMSREQWGCESSLFWLPGWNCDLDDLNDRRDLLTEQITEITLINQITVQPVGVRKALFRIYPMIYIYRYTQRGYHRTTENAPSV